MGLEIPMRRATLPDFSIRRFAAVFYHESLKAYLAPTGLVSEPRGDLTCRGDLRLEVPKTGLSAPNRRRDIRWTHWSVHVVGGGDLSFSKAEV